MSSQTQHRQVRSDRSRSGPVIVFCGPTARAADIRCWLSGAERTVVVESPARLGDLWRAAALLPAAIVLIDGLYETVPAVWHKEVLAVLDRDVPVYGASSMGALRAAELRQFGMIGVGQVYEWFADGVLDGDDEVAVMHAPAAGHWRPLSLPLVDLRAAIGAGVRAGAIDEFDGERILSEAKGRFYPDRTWSGVLDTAPGSFRSWVAGGHTVNIKAVDAAAVCAQVIRDLHEQEPEELDHSSARSRRLVETTWWDRFLDSVTTTADQAAGRPV